MSNNSKTRLTVEIERELSEKIKNIVYYEPSLTVKSFIEISVEKQIEIYQEIHNGTIPKRPNRNLKPGRPILWKNLNGAF